MTASNLRPIFVSDRSQETSDLLPTFLASINQRWPGAHVVATRKGESVPQAIERKKLNLRELGDFLSYLVTRCTGVDRGFSETVVTLQPEDAETLKQAAAAIERMAPYANSIRRVIAKGEKDDQ